MAGKPKAKKAAKPPKPSTAKKAVVAKTPKAAKTGAPPADGGVGHNSRIPPIKEMKPFFTRLDKLFEELATKRGEFMSDIKTVRGEAAGKLGVGRAVFNMYYDKYRAEMKFADKLSELEPKHADDMDRLMAAGQAFGADTPFGAYCIAQGGIRESANPEAHDELQPPPSELIQKTEDDTPPAAASDAARGREGFSVGMGDEESTKH